MNIQLGNHCQFLPQVSTSSQAAVCIPVCITAYSNATCKIQDMVVEFARMNMHQLLEETEKAVSALPLYLSMYVCLYDSTK